MTVAAANPISSELETDEEMHRTYTSYYEVQTSTRNTHSPISVCQASGIPTYGSTYSWGLDTDNWAWCNSIRAKLREDQKTTAKLWSVTVTHTTRPKLRCSDVQIENPLDEPYFLSGSFMQFRKPATQNNAGDAIFNTVGEPFIPAIERDDSRDTLIIEKNTATIDLALRDSFRDAVNSVDIWGLPPHTVKLQQWAWDIAYFGVCNAYVRNRLEFHINTTEYENFQTGIGFDFNVLNAGFRYKNDCDNTDKEKRFNEVMDGRDQPRHQPTLLGALGQILDLQCDNGAVPYYLNFEIYPEMDFHDITFLPDPLPGPFV